MSFALRLYPLAGGRMPAAGDVDFSDVPYRHCRFYLRFLIVTAFGLQSLRLGRGYDYKLLQRYVFSVRKQELQAELLDLQIMIRNILRLLIRCRVRPNGFDGMFRIVAGRSAHRATKSPPPQEGD